jgi:lysophospholipase L1-like esterase
MSWTKKLLFLAIGITAPLALAVFVLELIFGSWLREDEWSKTRALNIIRDVQINYDVENIYGKDLPTVMYTRDKNGLRGLCKDPEDISVLTIGGSTTDQRYVSDGNTYQDSLQLLLSQKYAKQICISNAGVDGHTTFGHLESFKTWFPLIEGLKPKYFLFYVGINDAGFRAVPNEGFDTSKRDAESTIRSVLRQKSAIYDLMRTLRNILLGINDKSAYAGHAMRAPSESDYNAIEKTNSVEFLIEKNTEAFEKRFLELMAQVRSYGAKPICVSQPHLFSKVVDRLNRGVDSVFKYGEATFNGLDYDASISSLNKVMMRLCLKNDGYFIDTTAIKFEDGDFYDSVHMTQSGAKKLGNYIYEEFIRQKIKF